MQFDIILITKILWCAYAILAGTFALLHVVWSIRVIKWWNQLNGGVPRTSLRAAKRILRIAPVINFLSTALIVALIVTIMTNIMAVDNSYLTTVLAIIFVPIVIVSAAKAITSFRAGRQDIEARDLTPKKMGLSAGLRKEGFDDGTFKLN